MTRGLDLQCSVCGEWWESSWKSAYMCYTCMRVVPSSDGVADTSYKPPYPACRRCGQRKGEERVPYVPRCTHT
jgi:DNA-directed RNA polymerase subunit RPC12/RpoP